MGYGVACGMTYVYGMVWRARHGIWYGLAGMAWYMVWSSGHCMVYGMAWWASHGICIGLARCGMVYVIFW